MEEFSAYRSWAAVLKDQERMLYTVNASFVEYFDKNGGGGGGGGGSNGGGTPERNTRRPFSPVDSLYGGSSLPLPVPHADLAARRTFSGVGAAAPVPLTQMTPISPTADGGSSPLGSFRLHNESIFGAGNDSDDDDTSVSGLSETCKAEMEAALTAWQEQLRVWIGVVRLDKELPERTALRQLLYGDPNNSAKNADVIVLFLMNLHINKKGTEELRSRFATVVDDPEEYIFNEEDEGLAFPQVPALKVTRSDGMPRYTALYCCVHKRNAGDWERDGNINYQDVFPLPIRLACRATAEETADPGDAVDRYIVMQDVVLAKQESFMHLKLMGADLDTQPKARMLQIQELEREFHAWQRDCQKFAGIIFGNFGSRVVVAEEFAGLVEEEARSPSPKEKKNKTAPPPMFLLSPEGTDRLCQAIADPAQRRTLFARESVCFSGKDAFGRLHKGVDPGYKRFRDMFHLHTDLALKDPDFPVPLPTYKRKPMEAILSERLGFKVYTEELITRQQLDKGCAKLRALDPRQNCEELYFTTGNRRLRTTLGNALLHQCGWLDSVGVLRKGSVPAKLVRFDADSALLAFDHVPVKATVHLFPGAPGTAPGLRVWVGAIKLDKRYPEFSALQHFLYGDPNNTAEDADVIALYFTDLHLDEHNVGEIRHLLRKNVRNPDDYVYNEEDPGLQIKNIPAILVKIAEGDPRYVALFACVHKRNVGDLDGNNQADFEDTFPLPASLMCRSHLKNEFSPNFKAHLVQDCLLFYEGKYFHLVLFGLNFDTSNDAQLGQVVAMERCMEALARDKALFTAIAFGDFNNRLVCTSDLKSSVKLRKNEASGKPVLMLAPGGVEELVRQIMDPVLRRELFLRDDSWSWTGVDAVGTEIREPPLCFRKLSELFELHRDLVEADPNYELSLPTYKRTPIGDMLSRIIGFKLKIGSLLAMDKMLEAFKAVDISETPLSAMPPDQARRMFFGDAPIYLDTTSQQYPVLDMGWPDGIGVFKTGPLPVRIENWGTADEVLCGEHVPIRASAIVTLVGSAAKPSLWSMNGRKNPGVSPIKNSSMFAF
jgi:hypothetical protein